MESNIENVLIKVAKIFNDNKINWAIGASTMLRLRGIEISIHDLDIMVHEDDFLLAHTYLLTFCEELFVEESSVFKTSNFKRYRYNGIEIDLMSGFGIIHDGGLFDYRFIDSDGSVEINTVKIPLCYVEDWLVFYHLMPNRSHTIQLIKTYIITNPLNKTRMNNLLNLSMPDSIISTLINLMVK